MTKLSGHIPQLKYFLMCLCMYFLVIHQGKSQHGALFHSDYSPISAAMLNPALAVNSYTYREIKLFGAGAQVHNNYLFWRNADLQSKLRDNTERERINVSAQAEIIAPSFIQMKEHLSFGVFTRSRNFANIRNMPFPFAKFGFEGLDYPPQHGIAYEANNAYVKAMAWGEIDLHFGGIVKQYGNRVLSAGMNLKVLNGFGYAGVLFNNIQIEVDSLNMQVNNFDGSYAIAVPGWGKGYGTGMDIGFSFTRMIDDDLSNFKPHATSSFCKKKVYKYRIAASLNDLGFIRFNNDVRKNDIENQNFLWNAYNSQPVDGLSSFDFIVTEKLKASQAQFDTTAKYTAFLPLTLTAQADYNYENGFYARANLVLGMNLRNSMGVERMSMLNLAMRYQSQWFEAEIPLSIYRIHRPGIGLNLRAWGLQLGTSNVIPLLFKSDLYSFDAYASLSIPIYYSKACRSFRANQYRFYRGMYRLKLFRKKKNSERYF